MKTTYSASQAQSKLPGLLKEVNEGASSYGITVHNDVKGYLIGKGKSPVGPISQASRSCRKLGTDFAMPSSFLPLRVALLF